MTVLIAATGEPGARAEAALPDRDVLRVETLAAARDALGESSVVIVGDLADGSPGDLRDAARESGVPTVRLGGDERGEYDATVEPGDPEALRDAVEVVERAAAYREAVDAFYELCRERTAGEHDDDGAVRAARERALARLRDLRAVTDRPPYEHLLEAPATREAIADHDALLDEEDADEDDSGDDAAGDPRPADLDDGG